MRQMKTHLALLGLVIPFVVLGCKSSESDTQFGDGDSATDSGNQDENFAHSDVTSQGEDSSDRDASEFDVTDDTEQEQPDAEEKDVALDINFEYDSIVSDGSQAEACVDINVETSPLPLDIYFMLDASTSMGGDCDITDTVNFKPSQNTRWCNAINAIAGYVSSPEAKGNRAALQYFKPYEASDCKTGAGYNTPKVPLDFLSGSYSGHAKEKIVEGADIGLNWASPHSATPTEGALRGLAQFTANAKTPGREIIGILVTDGVPCCTLGCTEDESELKVIAADHYKNTTIHTFMVGISGANYRNLESWANYPGAIKHHDNCGSGVAAPCAHYDVGDGNPTVFIQALKKIQKSAVGCKFNIPASGSGISDIGKAVVEYYPGSGGPMQKIPKKDSQAACGADEGWFFDNPASPHYIELCPATCSKVQADDKAKIKVRIPCEGS